MFKPNCKFAEKCEGYWNACEVIKCKCANCKHMDQCEVEIQNREKDCIKIVEFFREINKGFYNDY